MVERLIRNQQVAGSNPIAGSIFSIAYEDDAEISEGQVKPV